MKSTLFFFFLVTVLFGDQKICLNMIVKNESKVIERCLNTVKPVIDYWVIVDTGSTDGTQEIIKECMKNIPGELHEKEWVDFAYNRNESLQLAKSKGDYLLFIDADDVLVTSPSFTFPELNRDGYYINIQYDNIDYVRLQLIKSNLDWFWEGVVHEVLVCNEPTLLDTLEEPKIQVVGGGHRSNDPEKYMKDAELLKKALLKDPTNTRNTFYLAQSYRDAAKPELAIKSYQDRVNLGGWDQEVFWSIFQIAKLKEEQNYPKEEVIQSYVQAFEYRPTRAEPLYHLAQYYRFQKDYLLSYLTAKYGLTLPLSNDILFVESWIYEYGLLLELSISAYWIGQYQESFDACIELLAKKELPQNVKKCVESNLRFSIEKLQ